MDWHISKICVHINAEESLVQCNKPWMLQTISTEECKIFSDGFITSTCSILYDSCLLGKDICAGTCTADSVTLVMECLVSGTFNVAKLSNKNLKMNSEWNCGESVIGLALWQWIMDLFERSTLALEGLCSSYENTSKYQWEELSIDRTTAQYGNIPSICRGHTTM